jgi:hypothetical protein
VSHGTWQKAQLSLELVPTLQKKKLVVNRPFGWSKINNDEYAK